MWNIRSLVAGSWGRATASAVAVALAIVAITHISRDDSKRIDAQLALADAYFDSHDLASAETAYRAVLASPGSDAFWYAKYKLGLIDLEHHRFHPAAAMLYEVAHGTKDNDELAGLHHSSSKDYVRAFAQIGDPDTAYATLHEIDPDRAVELLEILADSYMMLDKANNASRAYQQLIKIAFSDDHVCLWQYDLAHIQLALVGTNIPAAVTEIESLVRLWKTLHGIHRLPAGEDKDCHDNAAAMSGELARAYHAEAAKTHSADTLGYAERLYRANLEAFPDAADFAMNQYYYAELLWTRAQGELDDQRKADRWMTTATAFIEVVDTRKVDAKLLKEAAYAAVLGWKNATNADRSIVIASDAGVAPIPLPVPIAKLIAAIDAYIAVVANPGDDDVIGVQFIKASTYRRYHHFDEAIALCRDILANHPDHAIAEDAATVWVDALHHLGRHDEKFAVIDSLVASRKFLGGKSDAWLVRLRTQGLLASK
jgi:tetratricopeptide (TPR) repeat protein